MKSCTSCTLCIKHPRGERNLHASCVHALVHTHLVYTQADTAAHRHTAAGHTGLHREKGDDDDVYYYIRWGLKLEGETENMGVCTKERKGVTAAVLMATTCTNSLGGESGGQRHEGCEGRSACWKFAAVSGSGAGGRRC